MKVKVGPQNNKTGDMNCPRKYGWSLEGKINEKSTWIVLCEKTGDYVEKYMEHT
jgi:hypothetical protein